MEVNNKIVLGLLVQFSAAVILVSFHQELSLYYFLAIFLSGISINTLFGEPKFNLLTIGLALPFISIYSYPEFTLVIIGLSAISSYYYRDFAQVLLVLAFNLFVLNFSDIVLFLSFVTLVIAFKLSKLDMRAIIASGLIMIVIAAYKSALTVTLGDVAYFDLLFGTIGIIVEGARSKIPSKLVVPLTLLVIPLISWLLPLPETYYWWSPKSFFFNYGIINVWLPGLQYFPLIEMFPIYYIAHFLVYKTSDYVASHLFISLIYYVSSLSSYLFFSSFNKPRRVLLISSILYAMLTPITSIPLSVTYSLLPFALYLARILSLRNYVIFFTISLISSSIAYPFNFAFASVTNEKVRKEYIAVAFTASLFWIIPYFLLGYPSSSLSFYTIFKPIAIYYALFIVGLGVAFVTRNKVAGISVLLSLAYILFGLPYFYLIYPFVILTLFAALLSTELNSLMPVFFISIFLISAYANATQPFLNIPSSAKSVVKQLEGLPFGLVYWNSSYKLLSPLPVTNITAYASYIVENDIVTNNTNFVGYPLVVVLSQKAYSQYISLNVSPLLNSHVVRYNGSFEWIVEQGGKESEVALTLNLPQRLVGNLLIVINITNLEYFYISVLTNNGYKIYHNTTIIPLNTTVYAIDLICYNPQPHQVYNVSIFYVNSSNEKLNLLLIPPKPSTPVFIQKDNFTDGNLMIQITSEVSFNITFNPDPQLNFTINGASANITQTYELKPGKYIIVGSFAYKDYFIYGEYATIAGFIIGFVYVVIVSHENLRNKLYRVLKIEKIKRYVESRKNK
ncbi:hypothetical protein [Stygiolobus azoricus]|uniref:Uncharacterized protein n=1 Tax=Stygiolobus azoricus TaxID=41675 RepID=A0A650CNV4_9CREN|nr:hypothetical protein [Stygiolobus azoricus]QGR19519.1 hypothetical protein D1868_05640 [Stygiolobus azoricus]